MDMTAVDRQYAERLLYLETEKIIHARTLKK